MSRRMMLAGLALLIGACSRAPQPLPTPTVTAPVERTPVPTIITVPTEAPSDTPSPTETAAPTEESVTATPEGTPDPAGGQMLASFTFSETGIWGVGDTEEYTIAIADGVMNITLKQPDRWALSIAGVRTHDFVAQVTATASACSGDDSFGLLFRFVDASNFYYYGLGCDATYRVRHYQDGAWNELIDWAPAPAANADVDAENLLAVRGQGSEFQFFVNDSYLSSATDSSFANGAFGLLAHAGAAPGLAVKFDNLQIREANQ